MIVCGGALLQCSLGTVPSQLIVNRPKITTKQPLATVMDHQPNTNVPPFTMCTSPANPAVQAQQGAPAPCTPVTPNPWSPGAVTVQIDGVAALHDKSKLLCQWGGIIQVIMPGQLDIDA